MNTNPYESPKVPVFTADGSDRQSDTAQQAPYRRSIARVFANALIAGIMGTVGAFLVWNYTYSIGDRVISDQVYDELHRIVCLSGCVFGAVSGTIVSLLRNRRVVGTLLLQVSVGLVLGAVGAGKGWREGVIAYFGSQVLVLFVAAALSLPRDSSEGDELG